MIFSDVGRLGPSDSLQEIVHDNPDISQRALWHKLGREIGKGIIVSLAIELQHLKTIDNFDRDRYWFRGR
jgi:hypothetical protein